MDSDRKSHKRRAGEEKMSNPCQDGMPSYKGIVTKNVAIISQQSNYIETFKVQIRLLERMFL